AKLDGVQDVFPIQVFMNNCRASLDLVVFNGMPAEKLRKARELHLIDGDWADFERSRDATVVGQVVARRRGLRVGQLFRIGEVTVRVVGIFRAAVPAEENFLYTHLLFLQQTAGLRATGTVTQLEVRLADGADPDATARAIDALYRGGPVPTD